MAVLRGGRHEWPASGCPSSPAGPGRRRHGSTRGASGRVTPPCPSALERVSEVYVQQLLRYNFLAPSACHLQTPSSFPPDSFPPDSFPATSKLRRQLIRRNFGHHAWELAASCSALLYFQYSLQAWTCSCTWSRRKRPLSKV